MQLFEAMYSIVVMLSQLQKWVNGTCLAAGSEVYAALQVFHDVKVSRQGREFKSVVKEIERQFARKPRKAKSPEGKIKQKA